MAVLDRWKKLLDTPLILEFPNLQLIGKDHEPVLLTGRGTITFNSNGGTFELYGAPENPDFVFRKLEEIDENPYDTLALCRLIGTDDAGTEWSGGYVYFSMIPEEDSWVFKGELKNLSTTDRTIYLHEAHSTELVFQLERNNPLARSLQRVLQFNPASKKFCYQLEIEGSKICFIYDHGPRTLIINASHSESLKPPYIANWIAEPLRILFGQLIYPRLVAQNSDRNSWISLRPVHSHIQDAFWAALFNRLYPAGDHIDFWPLYEGLLKLIADDKNFESHKITQLYEEIIQASIGSRWVWALTFCSSIEALTYMILPRGTLKSDADDDAIKSLTDHIKSWNGSSDLKQRAISSVHHSAKSTAKDGLRQMLDKNYITGDQFDAWNEIRNAVMHGDLISPYSVKDEDEKILSLCELMHSLTKQVIKSTKPKTQTYDPD